MSHIARVSLGVWVRTSHGAQDTRSGVWRHCCPHRLGMDCCGHPWGPGVLLNTLQDRLAPTADGGLPQNVGCTEGEKPRSGS